MSATPPLGWAAPVRPFGNEPGESAGTDDDPAARVAAVEMALRAAEERARRDEEEWLEEERYLQEQEEWRREARAAQEERDHELEHERQAAQLHRHHEGQRELPSEADFADPHHPEVAPTSAFSELMQLEGNRQCFDCDAALGPDLHEVWWSLTHGTLLCATCAAPHAVLGSAVSEVRRVAGDQTTTLSNLDVLYAGGNASFADFLADDAIGVPRRVWLALPLETRYLTPAADLYRRRLQALMDGEDSLPSDLRPVAALSNQQSSDRPIQPPGPPEDLPSSPLPETHPPAPAARSWCPPEPTRPANVSMTDFLVSMADMRRRVDAAQAAHIGRSSST
jgi:hypothetical protein